MTYQRTDPTQDKTRELLDQLAAGVAAIRSTDEWRAWLETASKFYRYSFGNQILIAMQKPTATFVAGFHKWLELGRHVNKGEKGLRILAPCVKKFTEANEQTGEDETSSKVVGFRGTSVFDISQTDGDPLPEPPCHKLTGQAPSGVISALCAFAASQGVPSITFDAELPEGRNGQTSTFNKAIEISGGLDDAQVAKTLAHEIAHAMLHCDESTKAERTARDQRELEAESVAYLVLGQIGVDTSAYTFGYVAGWTRDSEDPTKAIQASGQRIVKTAHAITDGLAARV